MSRFTVCPTCGTYGHIPAPPAPRPSKVERIAELRQELRAIAWGLAEVGVPAETIVDDTRAGIGQAVAHRDRAGR